jgi:hypothetical protein
MNYRSGASLFGLPLVHVAMGQIVDGQYRRGIARAWVAIGDVAVGALFAAGGLSMGLISVGGLALGIVPIGGFAVGGAAVGGLAMGAMAIGGAAFGWVAAAGGLAVAHDFASGGLAVARHANDAAAADHFAVDRFFRLGDGLIRYSRVIVVLPVIVVLVKFLRRSRGAV